MMNHREKMIFQKTLNLRKITIKPNNFPNEKFELYSIPSFTEKRAPTITLGSEIKSSKVLVYENDCLFSKLNPHVSRAWVVQKKSKYRQIASTEFLPFYSKENIDNEKYFTPNFLWVYFQSNIFRNIVLSKAKGTTGSRKRLKPIHIFEESIKLLPLSYQNKIDKKIIDIKKLNDEISLLKENQKINFSKLYSTFLMKSFTKFQDKWEESTIGDNIDFQNGYAFKSEWFTKQGIKLVKNVNIAHGKINWESDISYISENRLSDFSKFKLHENDILISLDRPIISTGVKIAKVSKNDIPSLLLQRVAKAEFLNKKIIPDFFYYWLQSPIFLDAINPGRSIGVPHISTKEIKKIPIYFPDPIKQMRIVKILEHTKNQIEMINRNILTSSNDWNLILGRIFDKVVLGKF